MQTQQEQNQKNAIRLRRYFDQLNTNQKQRSRVAAKIKKYSDKAGLNIIQRCTAIKLALGELKYSRDEEKALTVGLRTARTLAQISLNNKLRSSRADYVH